jgi:hypothetical protein
VSHQLTLELPDDPDANLLDAAIHEYLMAAERGTVDGHEWAGRLSPLVRPQFLEFLRAHEALARPRTPPPRTTPPALPAFGRYSRLRLRGKGGMGSVYKADDSLLERVVAVKVLHADLAVNPADVERFLREARVMARLQHRNIIPVYDFGEMPGPTVRPYFTMQLVEGSGEDPRGDTLSLTLKRFHAAPTPEGFQGLVTAFVGVCDAVAHAHQVDVLHRDLKPGNVLMLGERDVLVVDWGLSKVLTPDSRRTTALGGTPEYLAPEVASGGEVGKPADVFGLGGILATLLTGRPVYPATDGRSAIDLAANADTAGCLARLRACGQPAELVALAERCLTVRPEGRPTAAEVAAGVSGYLASVEERARAAEIEAAKLAEREEHGRRRRKLYSLLALAAVILVGFGSFAAVWYVNDRAERRRADELAELERATELRDRDGRVREATAAAVTAAAAGRQEAATAALERARGALGSDPPEELRQAVTDAERLLRSAVELDDIRQDLAVRQTDPQLPDEGVATRYAEAFAALGIDPTADDAAERIAASPLKASLVVALDDWVQHRYATASVGGVPVERLLEVARAVDPDPEWGDQFRDPAVRSDPARLIALAARAPVDRLSLAQTATLVRALPHTDPHVPKLLAAAESRWPNDFWLNLAGAAWRYQRLRVGRSSPAAFQDALAYARTASALRPDSLAALLQLADLYDLFNQPAGLDAVAERVKTLGRESWMADKVAATAARKRGKYKDALAHCERASAATGHPPARRLEVAHLHLLMADHAKAEEVIDEVLKDHPKAVSPRAVHALLTAIKGQLGEAEKESRAVIADDPPNALARVTLALVLLANGRVAAAQAVADTVPRTSDSSFDGELLDAVIRLARGDHTGLLAAADLIDQNERYTTTGFFRSIALAGLGRFADAKAAFDAADRLRGEGVPSLAAALNLSGFVLGARQFVLTEMAKVENTLEAGMAKGFDRQKFTSLTGLQRMSIMHVADMMVAKRWMWAAACGYRELLSPATPLSGTTAQNNSLLLSIGSYRFHGIRALAVASVGGGRDAFRTTDKDRAECRADALRLLEEELKMCQEFAARKPISGFSFTRQWDGGTPAVANLRLHLLRDHPDLDAIRNPVVIAGMPEADRKTAERVWKEADELYQKLNPPLDLPGVPK